MDEILSKASNQAVSFAIRSGISLASGIAIRTVTKLVERIPESEKQRVVERRQKLETKIAVITPAIALIRSTAAQGRTALDPAVDLVDKLTKQVELFEASTESILDALSSTNQKEAVKQLEREMDLLSKAIDEAVPLVSLAITTSGLSVSRSVPRYTSIGRVIEAAAWIERAEARGPVGPQFDLKLYSVFYNPARLKYVEGQGEADPLAAVTWKELFARARVQIKAVGDFQYQLVATENFDDGRYHDEEETPGVKTYPLSAVRKLFFTASGRLLKLEGSNAPVLILKLDKNEQNDTTPEWIALGEQDEAWDSDSESEPDSEPEEKTAPSSTKLSLLEYLLRLLMVQHADKKPLVEVTDERLCQFLQNELPEKDKQQRSNDLDLASNTARLENLSLKD